MRSSQRRMIPALLFAFLLSIVAIPSAFAATFTPASGTVGALGFRLVSETGDFSSGFVANMELIFRSADANASTPFTVQVECSNTPGVFLSNASGGVGSSYDPARGLYGNAYPVNIYLRGTQCETGSAISWRLYNTQAQPPTGAYGAIYPNGSPGAAPPPAPVVTAGNCIFDAQRIALVALAAGFTGLDLQRAVAIALAESAGKVNALNKNTGGSYDIGLWQINDVAHPTYDRVQLGINPFYNATAAKEIYTTAGNKFTPWVTYNTSRYVNFMSAAKTAIDANNGDSAALSNCAGAIATDATGNPVTPPGASSYCGFSLYPLDYLKCLFIPSADSFKQWNTLQGNFQTKPPFSIATAAVSFAGGAFGGNYLSPVTGQTCYDSDPASCANGQQTNFSLPNSNVTYNFNPISSISEKAKAAPGYQKILGILNLALWLGFIFYIFSRISRSFGSKESAVSE